MTRTIDLNCDMGESFGAWTMGQDAEVLAYVSSANIACGFHAGDPATMRRTVSAAVARDVAIGAHPSLPDLAGFGRREMRVSPDETYAMTLYQIGALAAIARAAGARPRHVKPHGALYNMAAKDRALADAIAHAVRDFDAALILVGLAGSELPRAGEARRARGRGTKRSPTAATKWMASLMARRQAGRGDRWTSKRAVAQAISIATRGEVITTGPGGAVRVRADTICVHGDRADAGAFRAAAARVAAKWPVLRFAAPGSGTRALESRGRCSGSASSSRDSRCAEIRCSSS